MLAVAAALFALIAAAVLFACSQTPTSVPVRTFERAQRMDVVCLRLFGTDGNPIVPEGLPQENCAPVPSDVNGGGLTNQLFALVTQTTRGALSNASQAGVANERKKRPISLSTATPASQAATIAGWGAG